jgi:hypothetical protein
LRIAKSFRLSKREVFWLTAAIWFQNTGYYQGDPRHEEQSCELGTDFLNSNKIPRQISGKFAGSSFLTGPASNQQMC